MQTIRICKNSSRCCYPAGMRIKSHQKRNISAVVIGLLTLLLTIQPAYAHTKLVSASPATGSTVENWPTQITLEFDEELQNLGPEKANFLVVNNSVGDQVSETDEIIDGNKLTVTLSPNEIKGPVLVYYRVVSTDGHPVEGEYKFTYGVGETTAEGVTEGEEKKFPITVYLASAVFIISGLFFSIYSYRRRNQS
jgi:methionine-rich copper-binding protein CopC